MWAVHARLQIYEKKANERWITKPTFNKSR